MSYNIETLKTLPTKDIVEAIKKNRVEEDVIETIAFAVKQPTRKFYNSKVYSAILYTAPYEEIAINVLEKLIDKKKVSLIDFLYFFENKNISKNIFNIYLQVAIDIVGEDILKVVNQADLRIDNKFLKKIIELGLEKSDILLNKNLSKNDFIEVLKRHIDDNNFLKKAVLFDLSKYNLDLALEVAKRIEEEDMLKFLMNTHIPNSEIEFSKKLSQVIPNHIKKTALIEKIFEENIAEVMFDSIYENEEDLKDNFFRVTDIFYNYPTLLYKFFKNEDEYFNYLKSVNKVGELVYHPIKVSRTLQEELLKEFKEKAKFIEDVYKRYDYLEKIGRYLAFAADLDIAKEIVRFNDKTFDTINLAYLKRDDVVIHIEDLDLFLSDTKDKTLNKIIVIDDVELYSQYDQEIVLSFLIEKATKETKDYLFNSIIKRDDITFRDDYILKLTRSYSGITKLYKKIDRIVEKTLSSAKKYILLFKNMDNCLNLPKSVLEKIEKDYYFNNTPQNVAVIFNKNTALLKQKNIPAFYLKGKGASIVALYRKHKLTEEELSVLIDDYYNTDIHKSDRRFSTIFIYHKEYLTPKKYSEELKNKLILIALEEKIIDVIPFLF